MAEARVEAWRQHEIGTESKIYVPFSCQVGKKNL